MTVQTAAKKADLLKRTAQVRIVDDEETYTWPKAVKLEIDKIIQKYPEGREASAVIPVLKLAQKTFDGWLPVGLMNLVAETLAMPPVRVYEVATFYDMFFTQPVGKNVVQVCTNISCMIRGCDKILSAIEEETGVKAGETSSDGLITVQEFECLGACCEAPMMMVNDHYHVNLDGTKTKQIMRDIKDGNAPEEPSK